YARHVRAERLGYLHGERAHAPRRAIYQDLLPRLNLPLVAKALQCGQSRDRYGSPLLERHVVRLDGQPRLGSAHVLGEGSAAPAEHLVARFESGDVAADRLDLTGDIHA